MFGLESRPRTAGFHGVPIRVCRDFDELKRRVETTRPDVLISTQEAATVSSLLAARFGVPWVHWFQSFEYCPPSLAERRRWGASLERVYPTTFDRGQLKGADLLLANSRFLRERQRTLLGTSSAVYYPDILPDAVLLRAAERGRGRYVAGLCGRAYKGADVFLALARRFPDTPFLLIGEIAPEYQDEVRTLANVRHFPWSSTRRFLAMSRIVLVPSRWPEPFGRIAVEAMANGIPTLISETGGLPEVVDGSRRHLVRSFLSVDAWAQPLERLLGDDGARLANAASGLRLSRRWLRGTAARVQEKRLRALVAAPRAHPDRRPVVSLLGSSRQATAFAMSNAHWLETIARRDRVRLAAPEESGSHGRDVTIHHDFTHRFGERPLPPDGHIVAMRTWDFGPYPPAWVRAIACQYDALWVNTRWIRQQAIRGGVPPSRIRVIPLGYDPAIFSPEGAAFDVPTSKSVRFLFVGAPVLRKGIDILLRAWRAAFRREDDVCLVLKLNPSDVFYQGIDWRDQIRDQAADPHGAEIVLIDRFMPAAALASLYRACQATVFPYRAEGFGMPILEGMACGCSPIVPRFGACLDYCDSRSAHFVRARRIQLPVHRRLVFNTLGFTEEVEAVDFCEVSVDALAETLVRVARMGRLERTAVARRSLARARRFTWDASTEAIERGVADVAARGTPVRVVQRRRAQARTARRLALARALYAGGL